MTTTYTIQMASKISGVGVHTIRAWEKRYKALVPSRDSAGHRVYSKSDVEKLMLLSELCLLGFSISKVANLTTEELKASLAELGKKPDGFAGQEFHLIKEKHQVDLSQSSAIMQLALKMFKLDVIDQELGKLKTNISSRELALDILLPLATEIKDLAQRGAISANQEQSANQLFTFHAGHSLFLQEEVMERSSLNIIVANLDSDDIQGHLAGLICNHYKHGLRFFGSPVSSEVLIETLKYLTVDLVIINISGAIKSLGKSYIENALEKIRSKGFNGEIVLLGSFELDREKFPPNKCRVVANLNELDGHFAKKRDLNS